MEEGKIINQGTHREVQDTPLFQELNKIFQKDKNNLDNNIETNKISIKEEKETEERDELRLLKESSKAESDDCNQVQKLFFAEDRAMGQVSVKLLFEVLNYLGGWWIFLLVFLISLAFNLMSAYAIQYLLSWSNHLDVPEKWTNYTIFCSLMIGRCIVNYFRVFIMLRCGVNASLKIHAKMFYHIIHAKLHEFLDKVPLGRIINRFSTDIDNIDSNIFGKLTFAFLNITSLLTTFTVLFINSTWA